METSRPTTKQMIAIQQEGRPFGGERRIRFRDCADFGDHLLHASDDRLRLPATGVASKAGVELPALIRRRFVGIAPDRIRVKHARTCRDWEPLPAFGIAPIGVATVTCFRLLIDASRLV